METHPAAPAAGTGVEPPVRVLVADDNPIVRAGLVSLLEAGGLTVVGEAVDGAHAIEQARLLRPDLVLLDVRMPGTDGVTAAGPISALTKVLMLSYDDAPEVVGAAIRAGASGYLVHGSFDVTRLVEAVRDTVAGVDCPLSPAAGRAVVAALHRDAPAGPEPHHPPQYALAAHPAPAPPCPLSRRESEVMHLIARGLSNGEIARSLVISEYTVKNHINRIFAKLGVRTRGAAIARWLGTAGGDGQ
ncbi:response regulator transcription factor [Actinomadura kijaniata]|uniref:response regulator transcription factor n=1 Tax=Actinomadura kijaniata TaxID=46161 RepID=UPI002FE92159